jgi:flagellar biosynthesis regulator FlbT
MATYKVVIVETLSRTIEVEADKAYDAVQIVKEMYNDEEYVLDADDLEAVEFMVRN